jgi:hypothetical protein
MVKCGVLFEVRTEFLNIVYTSFGFKGLICTFIVAIIGPYFVCWTIIVHKFEYGTLCILAGQPLE